MKVGICDWGIGGLGVLRELRKVGSTADIVYFSDAGFTPYGKVPKDELYNRWLEVKQFFENQKVDQVIVACNALSTVVKEENHFHTIATVVNEQLTELRNDKVAIIGGQRTIESGIYDLGFGHLSQVAQPLSALVELGMLAGDEVENSIKNIIEPINTVDKIVLACTHYPALTSTLKKMYPTIDFCDPSFRLAEKFKRGYDGQTRVTYYTTGDKDQMKLAAKLAWGIAIKEVEGY